MRDGFQRDGFSGAEEEGGGGGQQATYLLMAWVQLDLFEEVAKLPWYGGSPRALTRSANALFLRRKPQKTPAFVDGDQFAMFPELVKKAPWIYQGAPLLKEVSDGPR